MNDSERTLRPFYLFADSQLLFDPSQGHPVLSTLFEGQDVSQVSAAYIGVSNGDEAVFYDMFVSAMQLLGITSCRHIKEDFSTQDQAFLAQAPLILLAGGDTLSGMRKMQKNGMAKAITNAYYRGGALVGISAGAIQLGMSFFAEGLEWPMLQLIPLHLSVHEEGRDWQTLERRIQQNKSLVPGIGIPAGGGLCYYPDHSIEALNKPLIEMVRRGEAVKRNMLIPGK